MLKLLFGFQGRVGRLEWWLVRLGAIFLAFLLVGVLGIAVQLVTGDSSGSDASSLALGSLSLLLIAAVLWIDVAITVKRWHDRDKSGFWFFIAFVPLIGGIWTLVECGFLPGTSGPNKYDPESAANPDEAARVFS